MQQSTIEDFQNPLEFDSLKHNRHFGQVIFLEFHLIRSQPNMYLICDVCEIISEVVFLFFALSII